MRHPEPVARQNIAFLHQGVELLERLTPELYGATPEPFSRGGVGSHFRHILDHYDCFLDGVAGGRVDYDRRQRDTATEREPRVALERVRNIVARLGGISDAERERELDVAMDSGERREESAGWTHTTLGRELQYLLSHTVHHYALIRVMLSLQQVSVGPDFGVAPSTLHHEQADAVCAR